ncbi:MAG: hypothetical protein J5988_05255 [Eubacterium sp.]|nr:hypothetical protein [Eubacterium sp.]
MSEERTMNKALIKYVVYLELTMVAISLLPYVSSKITTIARTENNNTIETELTIIDKSIKNIYIKSGKSIVPVKQYKLTVDFGGETYIVSVGQDAYNSIEVGNSAMFICYYNSE